MPACDISIAKTFGHVLLGKFASANVKPRVERYLRPTLYWIVLTVGPVVSF